MNLVPKPSFMQSQWAWVVSLIGFVFVIMFWFVGNEIFTLFQAYGLAVSGYDTNTYSFIVGLWSIVVGIFVFAWIGWSFVQTHKDRDYFR